jgi:adenylate cyclase
VEGFGLDEGSLCIGIGISISISNGDVSFGESGQSHRDLTAIGTVVNTAARAQSAARGGQILVTKTVRDRCQKNIVQGDGNPYNLKGLRAPIELYDAGT